MKMKDVVKTTMMKRYLIKFIFRLAIFISVFIAYILDRNHIYEMVKQPIFNGITPLHILWFIFMGIMILHLFPVKKLSMALRKANKENFIPVEDYKEEELLKFVQKQNLRAWKVMLVWLVFNSLWGILYLAKIIGNADLLMITVFYFLCDYICILFYCPFQHILMKNRCCINCRIYDWGHFMMFTPMLFIKDFFSWSLFFTSCVVLLHWEIIYAKHPERFWHGSNKTLKCSNCKDKTCMMKRKVSGNKNYEETSI